MTSHKLKKTGLYIIVSLIVVLFAYKINKIITLYCASADRTAQILFSGKYNQIWHVYDDLRFSYIRDTGEVILESADGYRASVSQYDIEGKVKLERTLLNGGWADCFLTESNTIKVYPGNAYGWYTISVIDEKKVDQQNRMISLTEEDYDLIQIFSQDKEAFLDRLMEVKEKAIRHDTIIWMVIIISFIGVGVLSICVAKDIITMPIFKD